ncbi:MAG: hypothetical protein Q8L48_39125 [Archangium sp.]|nr:hypothetical protein [Archangium sp.]
MSSILPVVLALAVAAEVSPADRPARPAVRVLAYVGTGFLAVGLAFEITGRAGADPKAPVLAWSEHAQANTIGGIALMGAGLCLVTIAALLTPWHFPTLSISPSAGGVTFAFGGRFP